MVRPLRQLLAPAYAVLTLLRARHQRESLSWSTVVPAHDPVHTIAMKLFALFLLSLGAFAIPMESIADDAAPICRNGRPKCCIDYGIPLIRQCKAGYGSGLVPGVRSLDCCMNSPSASPTLCICGFARTLRQIMRRCRQ